MKRSRAPSQIASQTTTTTVVKKAKALPQKKFSVPRWVGKPTTGFPKELRMTHRYVDYKTFVSTGGAVGSHTFRCNGMYDPDYTATGHQPLYFDQLTAIYNHFTVLNSKIVVKFSTDTGNSAVPVIVNLFINDDTTVTPAGMSAQAEQNSSRFGIVQCTGNNTLTLKSRWSAVQAFGPGAISDPNLQGTSAADPTEQQYWSIQFQGIDGLTTVKVYAQIMIEYDAIWQELKDIAAS